MIYSRSGLQVHVASRSLPKGSSVINWEEPIACEYVGDEANGMVLNTARFNLADDARIAQAAAAGMTVAAYKHRRPTW